ncbi:Hypothetical protein NTJ_07127 [Nesidiocoris tenuis]|uniref:Uncharacterized protein n=1 Tax=Nesidiocoris tenuis TaxID=355587 RepID=A0ABN7AQ44_9HEMI|nr:Hypothetical protein NTJ_07127 [Nesidiocoris tenuis]
MRTKTIECNIGRKSQYSLLFLLEGFFFFGIPHLFQKSNKRRLPRTFGDEKSGSKVCWHALPSHLGKCLQSPLSLSPFEHELPINDYTQLLHQPFPPHFQWSGEIERPSHPIAFTYDVPANFQGLPS